MFPAEDTDPLGHPRLDCHAPWDPARYYGAVTCPEGTLLDTPLSAARTCERMGLPCPWGLDCLCRPCVGDTTLRMYPVQVRLGSMRRCRTALSGRRSLLGCLGSALFDAR